MAKTNRVPQEHGRTAYMEGRCTCEEICRKAARDYSRAYDRKKGVKPNTTVPWSEQELDVMRTSTLTNRELMSLLPGRTYHAITRKRALIGAGLIQRGLPTPHPGMLGKPAWNKDISTRTPKAPRDPRARTARETRQCIPLPEMVRGNRVKNKKNGKVYRICGVHLEADPPYVWLDRVDTMFSRLLQTPIDRLKAKYEGVQTS